MSRMLARVDRLTISFPGVEAPAVADLSLTVGAGECVALVGESGSGKTLTARALMGLVPANAEVSATRVEVVGADSRVAAAPAHGNRAWVDIRGAQVALVPQDALGGLDPLRRVEYEVGDALRLHRLAGGSERRARVIAALTEAGMPEPETRIRQRADELSGGLRQRALVASALIADPELILADEPTTALDAGHRGRVLAELRRRVDSGAGALLITHDLGSVRGIADRVVVMRDGRIIEEGTPDRVFTQPTHPFTRELLAADPTGRPRGSRLLSAPETAARRSPAPDAPALDAPDAHGTHDAPDAPLPRSVAPTLELASVTVSFGAHPVLDEAALSVAPGETVGLVGESGSGKTTLLRVALGLQSPGSGIVRVDGIDRSTLSARARRDLQRRIAFVPQDPLDSFPHGASGDRILRDALRAAGVPRAHRASRAAALAEEVGVARAALLRPTAFLSGGQRQRIAIARALTRDPEILLLDEPVSALDLTVQARVLDLLDELQEQRGTAYLLVSHDLDVIRHMSDRVLRLSRGRIDPE